MKKVIYAIAFISAFSAIFSCSKEDYKVSDLQTDSKLATQQNPHQSSAGLNKSSELNVPLAACTWKSITVTAFDTGGGPELPCELDLNGVINCPPRPPVTASLTIKVNTTNNGVELIPLGTFSSGFQSPPYTGNPSGNNIPINASGGTIEYTGIAGINITIIAFTSEGLKPFKIPIRPNRRSGKRQIDLGAIFTTSSTVFNLDSDCNIF
jgi:hypothetical protein